LKLEKAVIEEKTLIFREKTHISARKNKQVKGKLQIWEILGRKRGI
jgi:hypothetical protein